MEESSFAFKMDNYRGKTTVPTGLLVDAEAKKFKYYNQTLQLENHYMELADRTKTICISLTRGDAEVCLQDKDGNQVPVTLKKAVLILSYARHIFCKSRNSKCRDNYF